MTALSPVVCIVHVCRRGRFRTGVAPGVLLACVLLAANTCAADGCHGIPPAGSAHARSPEQLAAALRRALSSPDPSCRDRALAFLATLINAGRDSSREHEAVLLLAKDRECIAIASDIVARNMAGWYEERLAPERAMPLYYPLLHLLSVSQSKLAVMTLLMALPAAGFDPFFRNALLANPPAVAAALSRIATVESQLCCTYPGRQLVSEMQAIDLRLSLLSMYLEAIKNGGVAAVGGDGAMKKFVLDCLSYGGEHVGRVIRETALELAIVLIQAGQRDLLPAVERIRTSDPCRLYRAPVCTPDRLPHYDIARRYYPVREKAARELQRLGR